MSAEPPVGDELQQMLAGMRENVRGRLVAHPRRGSVRRRVGISAVVVALLGIGTASGALALGMLPQPFVAPAPVASTTPTPPERAPTTPSAPITLTPAPRPTTTPVPTRAAASIPTSCADVVPTSEYGRLFGSLVRQQVRPVPAGAEEQPYHQDPETPFTADASLVCRWSTTGSPEETDSLFLQAGTADVGTLDARLGVVRSDGWVCTAVHDGQSCQHEDSSMYYSERLDTTQTFFVRDDTWVSITQTNTPTNGLLDAVVQQTWG